MNGPANAAPLVDPHRCLVLLQRWLDAAERYWYAIPGRPELGCYGSGYNSWGVQTNQKYLGAIAALGVLGENDPDIPDDVCERARQRAVAALRFSLASHLTGDITCTDGTPWGHTWITGLGIERMMYGVQLLDPWLTDQDQVDLRRMLTSEAAWLAHDIIRGKVRGVVAGQWGKDGCNVPESNVWNGAILWRVAERYPDHLEADLWREEAHRNLINAVSIPADAEDDTIVAGKPIRERYVGANFFPSYGLDHHGYCNVGYQVICLSNAAMLHFDLKALGHAIPESLYHHQGDLWDVVRRTVFADGRLARIGGDTRVRYTYCQEYLLPSLVMAADCFGDGHAASLIDGQLRFIETEADHNGDGSFYGRRLEALGQISPYYYTRLEADRACVIGQLVSYARLADPAPAATESYEESVAGGWCEPEHGSVLHRSPTQLASFAWRAHGLAQGLCQPPDDGHLADWSQNLGGLVRFLGDRGAVGDGQAQNRRIRDYHTDTFDGGFATCGSVTEGVGISLPEGWTGEESAIHQIAYVALPDDHTVIGLQHCRTVGHRSYVGEVKGLHLNLPNDLFNGFRREIESALGTLRLDSPPVEDGLIDLGSTWAQVAGRVGVVGLYGADTLTVDRSARRRGGVYRTLYVEELCWHCEIGARAVDPESVILDVGWAVLSGVTVEETRRWAERNNAATIELDGDLRGVSVTGLDGRGYTVIANFGSAAARVSAKLPAQARDLASGEAIEDGFEIAANTARVLVTLP